MKTMTRTTKTAAAALAASLLFSLTACSGGSDKPAPTTSTKPTAIPTRDTKPIVAGSVKSVRVNDLSEACSTAIEPIRQIMKKYKSGLLITQTDSDAIQQAALAAQKKCTPEEFKRFEDNEFIGWNNAKIE